MAKQSTVFAEIDDNSEHLLSSVAELTSVVKRLSPLTSGVQVQSLHFESEIGSSWSGWIAFPNRYVVRPPIVSRRQWHALHRRTNCLLLRRWRKTWSSWLKVRHVS